MTTSGTFNLEDLISKTYRSQHRVVVVGESGPVSEQLDAFEHVDLIEDGKYRGHRIIGLHGNLERGIFLRHPSVGRMAESVLQLVHAVSQCESIGIDVLDIGVE
ncbi:hypothetical protein FQN49_005318 [Arthroderma sp. PD_2]|nr:hypothetical protein FQN49_005318 [Arthroderma sp. PD_2]